MKTTIRIEKEPDDWRDRSTWCKFIAYVPVTEEYKTFWKQTKTRNIKKYVRGFDTDSEMRIVIQSIGKAILNDKLAAKLDGGNKIEFVVEFNEEGKLISELPKLSSLIK